MQGKREIAPFSFEDITLRTLAPRDLRLTLAWRNRDDARVWFKHPEPIAWADHETWYAAYCAKPDDFTFVAERDGQAFGQSAIYAIDPVRARAEVGRFLVAPEWAGRGLMKKVCAATALLAAEVLALRELYLEVLAGNARAIAVYRACGFVVEPCDDARILHMRRRLTP